MGTLHTPSHSTVTLMGGSAVVKARSVYVWMGCCAMLTGCLSFPGSIMVAVSVGLLESPKLAIWTTIMIILQMMWQITGHFAICEYRRLKQLVHSLEHQGYDEQSQPSSLGLLSSPGELEDAKIKMHKALYIHFNQILALFLLMYGAIAGLVLSIVLSQGIGTACNYM